MKKIGFLSFGHWSPSAQSGTRSAADALLQSIDLAVAAEDLGRTAPTFAYTTSRASWGRRSRCWPPSAPKPNASKSAPA